jgi:hypothetical protein
MYTRALKIWRMTMSSNVLEGTLFSKEPIAIPRKKLVCVVEEHFEESSTRHCPISMFVTKEGYRGTVKVSPGYYARVYIESGSHDPLEVLLIEPSYDVIRAFMDDDDDV